MKIVAKNIGIDLGAVNTVLSVPQQNILLVLPSCVLFSNNDSKNSLTKRPIAVGEHAVSRMKSSSSDVEMAYLINSETAERNFDSKVLKILLRYLVRTGVGGFALVKPSVFITIPSSMTNSKRNEIIKFAEAAGAKKNGVYLVEKAFADALGLKLDVTSPKASMVVDIGATSTEIGIIGSKSFIHSSTLPIGGIDIDNAIREAIRINNNTEIFKDEIENIKKDYMSAIREDNDVDIYFSGDDLAGSGKNKYHISGHKIYDEIEKPLDKIASEIRRILNDKSPDIVNDIYSNKIYLTGGGSKLYKIDEFLSRSVGVEFELSKDSIMDAGRGIGELAERSDDGLNKICNIDFYIPEVID